MQVNRSLGFTLIELVIGIVVLSLSFTILFNTILPATEQGAKQIHQIKAAELGQAMMSEIMGKAFDERSDMIGGAFRCGEDQNNDGMVKDLEECTTFLGPDEGSSITSRKLYDDVDDYHNYDFITDSFNNISSDYQGFTIKVYVCNDADYDGNDFENKDANTACYDPIENNFTAKLIIVIVTTPENEEITFSSYKANF